MKSCANSGDSLAPKAQALLDRLNEIRGDGDSDDDGTPDMGEFREAIDDKRNDRNGKTLRGAYGRNGRLYMRCKVNGDWVAEGTMWGTMLHEGTHSLNAGPLGANSGDPTTNENLHSKKDADIAHADIGVESAKILCCMSKAAQHDDPSISNDDSIKCDDINDQIGRAVKKYKAAGMSSADITARIGPGWEDPAHIKHECECTD